MLNNFTNGKKAADKLGMIYFIFLGFSTIGKI